MPSNPTNSMAHNTKPTVPHQPTDPKPASQPPPTILKVRSSLISLTLATNPKYQATPSLSLSLSLSHSHTHTHTQPSNSNSLPQIPLPSSPTSPATPGVTPPTHIHRSIRKTTLARRLCSAGRKKPCINNPGMQFGNTCRRSKDEDR